MPGIFDDERRVTGPIWPNPYRTRPIRPLDVVAKGLKWPTLRRLSRLEHDVFTCDQFDRLFAFAGEARSTPWSLRPQVGLNDVQRARKDGLRWAKSVPRRRCRACPMPRIAPRLAG